MSAWTRDLLGNIALFVVVIVGLLVLVVGFVGFAVVT